MHQFQENFVQRIKIYLKVLFIYMSLFASEGSRHKITHQTHTNHTKYTKKEVHKNTNTHKITKNTLIKQIFA